MTRDFKIFFRTRFEKKCHQTIPKSFISFQESEKCIHRLNDADSVITVCSFCLSPSKCQCGCGDKESVDRIHGIEKSHLLSNTSFTPSPIEAFFYGAPLFRVSRALKLMLGDRVSLLHWAVEAAFIFQQRNRWIKAVFKIHPRSQASSLE